MNIFTAVANNDIVTVYNLLKYKLNDPNERNDNGLTGLHLCATVGFIELAVIYLEYGGSLHIKDYENEWTPLHRSIYFHHFQLTWLFIRSGAILDIATEDNSYYEYLKNKSTWKQQTINNSNNIDCRDKEGLTPMCLLSTILSKIKSNIQLNKHEYKEITYLYSFGKSDYQLGVNLPNMKSEITYPKRLNTLINETIIDIQINKYHSLALTHNGIYSWGHGRNGRLGHNNE